MMIIRVCECAHRRIEHYAVASKIQKDNPRRNTGFEDSPCTVADCECQGFVFKESIEKAGVGDGSKRETDSVQ